MAFGLGLRGWRGWGNDVPTAALAEPLVRNLLSAEFGAFEVHPSQAVGALDHGPAGEGLLAETGDRVPTVLDLGDGLVGSLEVAGRLFWDNLFHRLDFWALLENCSDRC